LAVLPYNGGRLPKTAFTLVEHYRDGDDAALDVVLLWHIPPLSRAEVAALRQAPSDQLELNVGHLGPEGACSVVALTVAVAVELAIVAVTFAITEARKEIPEIHLPDDKIRDLGPASSARELLALRRAILDGRVRRSGTS
jgi:hypothetical protein